MNSLQFYSGIMNASHRAEREIVLSVEVLEALAKSIPFPLQCSRLDNNKVALKKTIMV